MSLICSRVRISDTGEEDGDGEGGGGLSGMVDSGVGLGSKVSNFESTRRISLGYGYKCEEKCKSGRQHEGEKKVT
jgi:hypothetical protein